LMEPVFLGLDEVIAIHADQIERYGGLAGIRDMELLKSATAMPRAGFGGDYLHTDIFEMAAAYLLHIVRNHPFVDGNKRTGAVSAVVFLLLNRIELLTDEDSFERIVLMAAEGKMTKEEIARFFRNNTKQETRTKKQTPDKKH
jgi:death-on-curing protein